MKTTLKNFTPVLDALIENPRYGLVGATVFGVVWRYSQMTDGVCRASQETLAQKTGQTRKTVNKYIGWLVDDGYLTDLTPDLKNRPHVYRDSGKVALEVKAIELGFSSTGVTGGVTQSYSTVTGGVTESDMSKHRKLSITQEEIAAEGGNTTRSDKERPHVYATTNIDIQAISAMWGSFREELPDDDHMRMLLCGLKKARERQMEHHFWLRLLQLLDPSETADMMYDEQICGVMSSAEHKGGWIRINLEGARAQHTEKEDGEIYSDFDNYKDAESILEYYSDEDDTEAEP